MRALHRSSAHANFRCLVLFSVLQQAAFPVQAQQPPVDSLDTQQLQRQQQREDLQRRTQAPTPEAPPPFPAPTGPTRLPTDEAPCTPIRQLQLGGPYADAFSWLLPAASGDRGDDDPVGRCLGTSGIAVVQSRLQAMLVRNGYITSRVLVGSQQVAASGRLVMTVVPGLLHRTLLDAASDTAPQRLVLGAVPATPGQPLRLRDIEHGLENLKRIPNAEADIQIVPADEPDEADVAAGADPSSGASDLRVHYRPGRPLRLDLGLDDGGTRSTGKRQGTATLSWDNPLGLSDQLALSLGHSLEHRDSRGTRSAALNYSVPWGYWLFGASAARNRYRQSVAGASQTYVFSGTSDTADLRVQRVVWRSATARTGVGVRTARRSSTSFIDDTEIEVQRRVTALWEISVTHRQYFGEAVADAGVTLRQGTGDYGAMRAPEEAFGDGSSRMRLVVADLAYTRPLLWAGQRLRVASAWHGQWNRTPLTPQDRIAIGSRYSVRGFDGESSLLAERGWFWRNDLGWAVAEGVEAYLGLDAGHVGGPSARLLAGRSLAGGVVGLRGNRAGLGYDLFVGRPLHKPGSFDTARTTVGLQLGYGF